MAPPEVQYESVFVTPGSAEIDFSSAVASAMVAGSETEELLWTTRAMAGSLTWKVDVRYLSAFADWLDGSL